MAKLNKQEVAAVASKLHRELLKVAEEKRKQVMEHYVPSETYSKVKELLEKRDSLQAEMDQISVQLKKINKEVNDVSPFFIYSNDSKEEILNRILSDECKVPTVPSIEDLKDEVTIAAIDDSFDTLSFIENQIAKFK